MLLSLTGPLSDTPEGLRRVLVQRRQGRLPCMPAEDGSLQNPPEEEQAGPHAWWIFATLLVGALATAVTVWFTDGEFGYGIMGATIGLALFWTIRVRRRRSPN